LTDTVRKEQTCPDELRLMEVVVGRENLWRHGCELGYRSASLTTFVADGNHWLWNVANRLFQRAIKIVDFWHVCEHVSEYAKTFYGEGTESGRQWSMKVCGHLRAGDVDSALKEVEALNPCGSMLRHEQKHSLVTYLTNNRDRIDYPLYEALGISSLLHRRL
jgi:transposase